MDERDGRLLQTGGLAFFGKIMAGQSHEVTNVLNIINELSGLQEDLLCAAGPGGPPDVVKLSQIAERIKSQVRRGETLVRCMNRFAHSVDCPVTVFDLKETLDQIVCLARRSANLAKVVLEQEFPEASMPLEASPFGFQQTVFRCIEIALEAATEQRRITVSYQVSDPGATIAIRSADPILADPEVADRESLLGLLMRQLAGQLLAYPGGADSHRFLLFFPRPRVVSNGGAPRTHGGPALEDPYET